MINLSDNISAIGPSADRRSHAERFGSGPFRKAIRVLARHFYLTNSATWYEANLCAPVPGPALPPAMVIERVAIAGFEQWAKGHFYPDRPTGDKLINEIRSAEQYDHVYLWAKHWEEIVGYLKIGIGNVYIHDYRASMIPSLHTAMIYDTYVVDKFRRQGIASNLICRGMALVRQKGCQRIRCHIPSWNTASARTYRKCGFQPLAQIRFHRVMGRSFFSSTRKGFAPPAIIGSPGRNRLAASRMCNGLHNYILFKYFFS